MSHLKNTLLGLTTLFLATSAQAKIGLMEDGCRTFEQGLLCIQGSYEEGIDGAGTRVVFVGFGGEVQFCQRTTQLRYLGPGHTKMTFKGGTTFEFNNTQNPGKMVLIDAFDPNPATRTQHFTFNNNVSEKFQIENYLARPECRGVGM